MKVLAEIEADPSATQKNRQGKQNNAFLCTLYPSHGNWVNHAVLKHLHLQSWLPAYLVIGNYVKTGWHDPSVVSCDMSLGPGGPCTKAVVFDELPTDISSCEGSSLSQFLGANHSSNCSSSESLESSQSLSSISMFKSTGALGLLIHPTIPH